MTVVKISPIFASGRVVVTFHSRRGLQNTLHGNRGSSTACDAGSGAGTGVGGDGAGAGTAALGLVGSGTAAVGFAGSGSRSGVAVARVSVRAPQIAQNFAPSRSSAPHSAQPAITRPVTLVA